MSVHNKLEPIYTLIINSSDDIEQVLNHNEQDKEKISEILGAKYFDSIEQTTNYLDLGDLFKEAYWKSIGFTTCQEVVNGMGSYLDLLKHSITVYTDILTPLLIRSFKCHQMALQHFVIGKQETAIAAMAETGEIAKKIASEYENLSKKFDLLRDKEVQTLCALTENRVQICTKKRELAARQENGEGVAIYSREAVLKAGISTLHGAENSLWKIQTALLKVHTFLDKAERHSKTLANPDLANPDMIEGMVSERSEKADDEFYKVLERAEKMMDTLIPDPPHMKSFTDVVKSMKTGKNATIPITSHRTSIVKMLKSTEIGGIEKEFENSYLNWLALAKINQAMVDGMRKTIVEVEENRNDILGIERDPLVIALHATALNS